MDYSEDPATARFGGTDYQTQVNATGAEFTQARAWPVSRGLFFSQDDVRSYAAVAVLGQTVAGILFGLFFLCLFLRIPVAFSLALACLPILLIEPRLSSMTLLQETFTIYNSFILLAVPFFLLTANLMNGGGITDRLFHRFVSGDEADLADSFYVTLPELQAMAADMFASHGSTPMSAPLRRQLPDSMHALPRRGRPPWGTTGGRPRGW